MIKQIPLELHIGIQVEPVGQETSTLPEQEVV